MRYERNRLAATKKRAAGFSVLDQPDSCMLSFESTAMKKFSKNRLTPGQQSLFPGSNLFDKIARAVCRAGTLPRKELHEAWQMARRVRRRYRGGRVLDLACGHGLLAHVMLILDDSSNIAMAVDSAIPQNAETLSRKFPGILHPRTDCSWGHI